MNKLQKKVNTGAKKKINILALDVYVDSLSNNFKPSANGCKIPNIPCIFGPFLRCILLIHFLSNKVKNAIPTKINTKLCIPKPIIYNIYFSNIKI